ncbi:MAG TPA: hypothetical protein VM760_02120 [Sphingomicrobium sp.]|nr:hypothetical protein [Sphingomicrobium sp.]
MPIALLFLAFAASADPEPVVVVGSAWAPFISPMGEPFRPRAAGDDTLARWFQQGDKDSDGKLVLSEMESDAARFFATLDLDRDGRILPDEFANYERQTAPEIQVNARWRDPRSDGPSTRGRRGASGYDPYGLHGAARYALLNIPQPVTAADTNFDRSVTIEEFRLAAAQRFQLLDKNGDHQLDLAELRGQLPPTRKDQRRVKRDDPDRRIATPVPVKD